MAEVYCFQRKKNQDELVNVPASFSLFQLYVFEITSLVVSLLICRKDCDKDKRVKLMSDLQKLIQGKIKTVSSYSWLLL